MTDATETRANGCTCTAGSPPCIVCEDLAFVRAGRSPRARLNGQYDLHNLGEPWIGWSWVIYLNRDCEEETITVWPPFFNARVKTREGAERECLKWAEKLGIDARPGF